MNKPKFQLAQFSKSEFNKSGNQAYLFFTKLLSDNDQEYLLNHGIKIVQYIEQYKYLAIVANPNKIGTTVLTIPIKGFTPVYPEFKIAKSLDFLFKQSPKIYCHIESIGNQNSSELITKNNITNTTCDSAKNGGVNVWLSSVEVQQLANIREILWIEPASKTFTGLNFGAAASVGVKTLNAAIGRGLAGKNVHVGVGDYTYIPPHIDFGNRVNVLDSYSIGSAYYYHATGVIGTLAGNGASFENVAGMATKVKVTAISGSDIIYNSPALIGSYNMVLTNNSYALLPPPTFSASTCATMGVYNSDCRYIDDISRKYKNTLHIIAAGNNYAFSCGSYPSSYCTLAEGYQAAKNTLTVGNIYEAGGAYTGGFGSSRGPAADGRLKPEIVAKGVSLATPQYQNTFGSQTGTSFSAPVVTGTAALLIERYKQLNGSVNPEAALIKACLMNGADDLGNPGPDFIYGFGRVNAVKSVEIIENNWFSSGTLSGNDSNTLTVNLPSGIGEFRAMLYYHDTSGSSAASKSLVNNLDLVVIDPSNVVFKPWTLDITPANVANNAVRKSDTINNAEQVTLANPSLGNYKIRVYGTKVPFANQKYYIVYWYRKTGIKIIEPQPGSKLRTNYNDYIYFDNTGITSGTFTLEHSADSGSTWSVVSNSIPYNSNTYTAWTSPSTSSSTNVFRIKHNSLAYGDTQTKTFITLDFPSITSSSSCGNQVTLSWSSVAGANSYKVYRYVQGTWVLAAQTTSTSITIKALSVVGLSEYYGVCAMKNGKEGLRSIAQKVTITNASCAAGTDIGIIKIAKPLIARKFTKSTISGNLSVEILNKNYTSTAFSGTVTSNFSVNGSAGTSSYSNTIAANDTLRNTIATGINCSATGTYNLVFTSKNATNANINNDSVKYSLKHLANDPIVLPYFQDFESAADTVYETEAYGLSGIDFVDFTSSGKGRLNTAPGAFLSYGNRALCMDLAGNPGTYNQNFATLTLNMSNYSLNKVLLGFYYRLISETANAGDSVWARGSDTQQWISISYLNSAAAKSGFVQVSNIDLKTLLAAKGQTMSSSFQLRFGQYENRRRRNFFDSAGIIIDNLSLQLADVDMQMVSVNSPSTKCGQGADSVKITVKNNGVSSATNIPVKYVLDNGTVVVDTIKSTIAAGSTANFSFKTTISITDNKAHTLQVFVKLANDNNALNDSGIKSNIYFIKSISSFPFLDKFETNTNFFTTGTNSSWEWGTPNSYLATDAVSGNYAWATKLRGEYMINEVSYLNSPCFNFSSANANLRLSFHLNYDAEKDYDGLRLEYSVNGGSTWFIATATAANRFNYYNNLVNFTWDNTQPTFKTVGFALNPSGFSPNTNVRFRIALYSDGSVTGDGAVIDNFHVFDDATGVYLNSTTQSATATGTGTGWVHFNNGTNRFLSINDSLQSIGSTTASTFKNTGALRWYNTQFTMDRNWWVKSANPTGNRKVRLYYSQPEGDTLIRWDAAIKDFRDFGVTKYSGPNEDSSFSNDTFLNSAYSFFSKKLDNIPFFNGNYIEFTSPGFSEFWINGGTPTFLVPLNLQWTFTNGKRAGAANFIQWNVNNNCVDGVFEIYKCAVSEIGNCAKKIGQVYGACNVAVYDFVDSFAPLGIAYYQIRLVLPNGESLWSDKIKIGYIDKLSNVYVWPNPNNSILHIENVKSNEALYVHIFDNLGKLVFEKKYSIINSDNLQLTLPQGLKNGTYTVQLKSSQKTINRVFILNR